MNNIIKVFTKSPNRIDNILLFLQTPRADQKSNAHWTACFLIETDLSGRRKSLVYISLQRKYFEKLPRRCGRRFIMCSLLPPPFVFHTSNLCSSFFWHFQSSRHPIKMRARATVHKKSCRLNRRFARRQQNAFAPLFAASLWEAAAQAILSHTPRAQTFEVNESVFARHGHTSTRSDASLRQRLSARTDSLSTQ